MTRCTTIVPFLAVSAAMAAGPMPGVVNHWVANTSGGKAHVQNFIEDMIVWYPPDLQYKRPLVLTKSGWDEGQCGICSYHEGRNMGTSEWWRDIIDSRTATRLTKTCRIGNFHGRAFQGKVGPPPTGSEAPFIACTGNDTLRSVADPTALTFDLGGLLLVADNGPDQNIKIFDVSARTPRLVRTFGDSGGVFAGPVPGKAGIRRFWGPRGLGVDSSGNLYVGTTGMPMQVGGGTDIRVFRGTDSSLLWQIQGLSFVNSGDGDPDSADRSVYLNAERFHMDLSKTPGRSWSLAAATIDPFRYPDDPRLTLSLESVFVRRIGGKTFLYLTDMYTSFAAIVRFEPGSEIGIPTAFFVLGASGQTPDFWGEGKSPVWTPWPAQESNKGRRWMWRDANANGQVESNEFSEFKLAYPYNIAFDVDDRGDIWFGGEGTWNDEFKFGGILHMPVGGLDANGIPRFPVSGFKIRSVPFADHKGYVHRMKYLADQDVMFMTSGPHSPFSARMWRYDNWSDSARMRVTQWPLPYEDHDSTSIRLDVNTETMLLPMSFTADSEYVYLGYLDNGPETRERGEVTILDARTGANLGYLSPGPETEYYSGAIDLPNAINVRILPDGSRLVYVEEDGKGKVMVYHWNPRGGTVGTIRSPAPATKPTARWTSGGLRLEGSGWTKASLVDLGGRTLHSWDLQGRAMGAEGGRVLPLAGMPSTGSAFLVLEGRAGSTTSLVVPPRFRSGS